MQAFYTFFAGKRREKGERKSDRKTKGIPRAGTTIKENLRRIF